MVEVRYEELGDKLERSGDYLRSLDEADSRKAFGVVRLKRMTRIHAQIGLMLTWAQYAAANGIIVPGWDSESLHCHHTSSYFQNLFTISLKNVFRVDVAVVTR
ncbi:hypothetical protein V7S43_013226 [Phytophthora oleae]|uniref:Uncharacterized protein n=1 Tax=Phytophthora oleae TaxID=2107226 RepID=A0ABD3F6P2_9STRA